MSHTAHQNCRQFEFHVSRDARDKYQFDLGIFQLSGNVVFANFHAARLFAQKMNDKRDLVNYPEQAVRAGQLNAMGLIDEVLHLMVAQYRQQVNPNVMRDALAALEANIGKDAVDATLRRFSEEYPPLRVYRREIDLDEYLLGETGGVPHREIALEEMLLLWIANLNPAFSPFMELFDDENLEKHTSYPRVFTSMQTFMGDQPGFGPKGETLIDMLRAPALASPHSLTGQLEFLRASYGHVFSRFLFRLLGSLDLIAEEERVIFAGGGPGPSEVYSFAGLEADPERFTADREWMPNLVLIARNAYVWLDQLTRAYGRPIATLDQIPDDELDRLARYGITGLWLIGLWERSHASKNIKQMMGNPDAVASAYSLLDYRIADDLGGDAAVDNLRERAWSRGIRLASDMVPNHMGIDSSWVMEHPDWFLSLDYSPYPAYSFNGPNLSWNSDVGIYLEDHYFDRTDAAVVFKRVDHRSGDTKYIYHGNDGTSMPWNDTAQLNYLRADVREAVIQTILNVARQFPVIRFDAAMTLAKRHIQRLWFPEPGTGGAIASRADHAMVRAEFDRLIPQEFWREVVDRAAVEAPDTLLLAEAFWMMEGYFVRTLGMHRVYNSAFMNMIRDEENGKYRTVIKNTIEFDPEILRRYVNFMNNPDERTAVEQFGKGDKYFAVCTLMSTLPGLPMIGHGQIEGFTEKYGMEYRRAYWDEQPDPYLIARHEREIFPLFHKRYLFAGVENFRLYDFVSTEGGVAEDVFAYSNRVGDERALVVIHNKYATARGWIRTAAAYSVKTGQGDERRLAHSTLGDGMGVTAQDGFYMIFRELGSGLEYIRSSKDIAEHGLYFEVGAYSTRVFWEFREVQDNAWRQYGYLADYLNGQGVPSIEEALRETFLQPVHYPFRELVNAGMFRYIIESRPAAADSIIGAEREPRPEVDEDDKMAMLDEVESKMLRLLQEVKRFAGGDGDEEAVAREVRSELEALLQLTSRASDQPVARVQPEELAAREYLRRALLADPGVWDNLLGWLFTHSLGKVITTDGWEDASRSGIDEWLLGKILAGTYRDLHLDETIAWRTVRLVKVLVAQQRCFEETAVEEKQAYRIAEELLRDDDAHQFLGVNRYQGALYFNREAFDQLLERLLMITAITIDTRAEVTDVEDDEEGETVDESKVIDTEPTASERIIAAYEVVQQLQQAAADAEYKVENLLNAAKGSLPSVAS